MQNISLGRAGKILIIESLVPFDYRTLIKYDND